MIALAGIEIQYRARVLHGGLDYQAAHTSFRVKSTLQVLAQYAH